jgi:hypothetical protein
MRKEEKNAFGRISSLQLKGVADLQYAETLFDNCVHSIPLYPTVTHRHILPSTPLTPYNFNQLFIIIVKRIILVTFFDDSHSHWSLSFSLIYNPCPAGGHKEMSLSLLTNSVLVYEPK